MSFLAGFLCGCFIIVGLSLLIDLTQRKKRKEKLDRMLEVYKNSIESINVGVNNFLKETQETIKKNKERMNKEYMEAALRLKLEEEEKLNDIEKRKVKKLEKAMRDILDK